MIVLDNASYHNVTAYKMLNTSWKKSDIQEWLAKQGIAFSADLFKSELLLMVVQSTGRSIWTPLYHYIFNPIEKTWGIAKTYYNRHICRYGKTAEKCLNMWHESLQQVTPETWNKRIKHTEKEIVMWYECEKLLDIGDVVPL